MTKKIAIYNNKGGVAKTTSVINLAYCIQKNNKKVLVVDCDTQENCFSFFMTTRLTESILPTEYENVSHTTWTRYVGVANEITADYNYILFDLPPAMTDGVKQIIRHCGTVYVPTMLGEFEIQGLERVTVEIAKQNARLGGIFITMYQKQNDEEILQQFRSVLQSRLMQSVIPYSRTVRESQKAGLPIEAYFTEKKVPRNGNSWKIVHAYEELAKEITGDSAKFQSFTL
jgi:chromosome partitioning protein